MEALSQLALGSNPNAWQELVKPNKNAQLDAVKHWLRSDGDDMAALKEALIESYNMQRLTKISQRRGGGLSEAEDDDRPIQPLRSQRADQRRLGRGSQRRGDGLSDSEDDEQPARSQRAPERRRGRDDCSDDSPQQQRRKKSRRTGDSESGEQQKQQQKHRGPQKRRRDLSSDGEQLQHKHRGSQKRRGDPGSESAAQHKGQDRKPQPSTFDLTLSDVTRRRRMRS